MSTQKQTRIQAALARLSRGAVPVDGMYWLDPREIRAAQVSAAEARAAEVSASQLGAGQIETCGPT